MRQLIIGNNTFSSKLELYRSLMVGYMSVLSIFIGIFYFTYNTIFQIEDTDFVYVLLELTGIVSFTLNRSGKFDFSKIILLTFANLIVYVFAAKSNYETDTQYIFLFLGLSSSALFGFEKKAESWIFSLLPVALFLIGFYSGFSPLGFSDHPQSYIRDSQLINFLIASVSSIGLLFMLSKINFESEVKLKKNQAEISMQNLKLLKTNTELDRFVYSTSHDLRAPLRSVLGLVNLAKKSESHDELDLCLDLIRGRVEKLDELLKDITDYSRNINYHIQKKRIDVKALIESVAQEILFSVNKESVRLSVDVPYGLMINTDQERLKIVLHNIVKNAIEHHDYTKPDRYVTISAEPFLRSLTISVKDNGKGIYPDYQPFIFNMFYRASERAAGSGLGLYIVKEILEKLPGKISFHSEIGKGSTFEVTLPGVVIENPQNRNGAEANPMALSRMA
ncbi:MAG: HAMP domain-containing histidine kinase [Flammeovirgaceae bacterium]|nr:HAMP domain-containing histidine kinase [Flammeovirgaceae bacterium]